jgi:uncharacterized protein (TIGR03067 family)
MKQGILMVPVVFLLLAAEQGQKDTKKELKKFKGTWLPVSMELNGKKAPPEEAKGLKVIIEGNTLTIQQGEKKVKGTFTIDPSKDPKWLDSSAKIGGKELKTLGIYKFDGGKLTICHAAPGGGKRPKEFSSAAGTKEAPIFIFVYKKAKGE